MPLTLLQRAVIQRLREQNWNLLADAAREQWSAGVQMPPVDAAILSELRADLRADFEKANAQAVSSD